MLRRSILQYDPHQMGEVMRDTKDGMSIKQAAEKHGHKVLVKNGVKCILQQVNLNEKECVTALLTGNAAGNLCPSLLCLKYKRLPQDIVASIHSEWGIGKSQNGWITEEVFYEFLINIFHLWLVNNNIPLPVLYFMDGQSSHLILYSSTFCKENGIVLVALLLHSTHVIQPMDVSFRPLKNGWKTATDFAGLLKTMVEKTISPEILQQSFRKCGIFPWNPLAVDMDTFILSTRSKSKICKHLEIFLGESELKFFAKSGDMKDIIVEYWKHVKSSKHFPISSSGQSAITNSPQIPGTTLERRVSPPTNDEVSATVTKDMAPKTSIQVTVTEDKAPHTSTYVSDAIPSTTNGIPVAPGRRTVQVSATFTDSKAQCLSCCHWRKISSSPVKQVLFWPSKKPKAKKCIPEKTVQMYGKIIYLRNKQNWDSRSKKKNELQKEREKG
ncbi:hypothetical protein PR048_015509 [Dryococelus australis]|uniref:DDE-1 domain-containing protein n=1 Tax=Dryococelus australis TaxID=614101 RepID=A0ABQ9HHA3_9NEOP|nr:hypothetical protein PR048_015509 [Dryococelus australis]